MRAANETPDNQVQPLRAYWVGPEELYAAYSAEQALQLANQEYGQAFFLIDDVQPCEASTLEGPAYSAAGARLGTLWQRLALMHGPGYVCACQP
jgi:hypothetical protein